MSQIGPKVESATMKMDRYLIAQGLLLLLVFGWASGQIDTSEESSDSYSDETLIPYMAYSPPLQPRWELGNHGPFKRPNANILCKHGHFFPGCKWQGGRPRPTMFGRTFGLFNDIFGSWLGGGSYQRPLPGPGFDHVPAKPRKCPWREEKACEGYGPFKPPPPPRPPTRLIIDYLPPSQRPTGAGVKPPKF